MGHKKAWPIMGVCGSLSLSLQFPLIAKHSANSEHRSGQESRVSSSSHPTVLIVVAYSAIQLDGVRNQ